MTEHELAAGRQLSETKCVNKIYNIEIYVFFLLSAHITSMK